jgi:hypothetical protein
VRGLEVDVIVECFEDMAWRKKFPIRVALLGRGRFTMLNEWVATGVISRERFTVASGMLDWRVTGSSVT